jgi:hypothetical protein
MSEQQSRSVRTLLDLAFRRYLGSGDFNGFYLGSDDKSWRRAARALIDRGDLEVISESDFPTGYKSRALAMHPMSLRMRMQESRCP